MDAKSINPDVIDHSLALDEERIDTRSNLHYFRHFWDSYKGHVRGLLAGVVIGLLMGAAVGAAVWLFVPGLFVAATATTAAGLATAAGFTPFGLIAAFAGTGAMMDAAAFGTLGASASARASGIAEKHARMLDPAYKGDKLGALDDVLMNDGRGHHYEYPPERDKGKFFVWKSGFLGSALGAVSGAVLGGSALLGHTALFGSALVGALGGPIAAGAIICGLFGLTFGVERSLFKSVFNQTDANIKGHLHNGHEGPDLGRVQSEGIESDAQLSAHRLQRQDDITHLQKRYNDQIFWGGLSGMFRGFAGGIAIGVLIGAAAGALILGGAALLGIGAITAFGLQIPMLLAASGAVLGMTVFSEAGGQAGTEATARAIDEEFDRNQELRARGITPQIATQKAGGRTGFSWRIGALMGGIGAAVGAIMTPVLGIGAGVHAVTFAALSTGGLPLLALLPGAVIGGLLGGSYGLSASAWRKVSNMTDRVYERSYFKGGDTELKAEPATMPLSIPVRDKISAQENSLLDQRLASPPAKSFVQQTQQGASPLSIPGGL